MSGLAVEYQSDGQRRVTKHVSALSPGDEFSYGGGVFCVLHVCASGHREWLVVVAASGLKGILQALEFTDGTSLCVVAERSVKIEVR